ncbi:ABC transporter permease [Alicyclobacillus fastidiosus]|uniref:ABC transporter permease n=1 Tax=Alicyclobacillus fastidiosus TaxID=392011 RepID=A0ABV5AA53_9BACL|nr:ABC transporter permease [Alicyclobacillus fastidiosus]WEH07758.1 ABC transporter permease [Alicyclobacillus fastidiosus]
MNGALMSDWLKLRKTWIPLLTILGPLGVVGLNAMRYVLSHGAIVIPGDDTHNWALLIQNTDHLLMPTLILGVTLFVSMLSGLEHRGHTWKQLLALPVSRAQIYLSKFIWIAGLLAVSSTLCAALTLCIGFAFGFSTHVAWLPVLRECYYPYLAAYGMIAIQLLISMVFANQAFAVTLGVLGMIMSGLTDAITPDSLTHAWHFALFVPWVYPSLSAVTHGAVQYLDVRYVVCGLVVGSAMVGLGSVLFATKEVR